MSKELKDLIAGDDHPTHPLIPNPVKDLWNSIEGLDAQFRAALKGKKMSLSKLKASFKSIIERLDNVDSKFKTYRSDPKRRAMIPNGYNAMARRTRKVAVDLLRSIDVPKADRVGARELLQMYKDSFPYNDFASMLLDSAERAKLARQSSQMGSSVESDQEIRKLASSYSKYYSKLPRSLNGQPFAAILMPITPIYEDLSAQIDPGVLERSGLKVTRVGDGYIVLENQALLVFDIASMGWDTGLTVGTGKVVRLTGPKKEARSAEMLDSINDVLETVNKKSSTKYVLASSMLIPNPRNAKQWMAWVVTNTQRKQLEQVLRTVEVRWGLPFSLEDE
mgnify:CR=1 FL=1